MFSGEKTRNTPIGETMGHTPKPSYLSVVSGKKKPRVDETSSFEAEGVPTKKVEIPVQGITVEDKLLRLLPIKRFARGEIVISEQDVSNIYYVIEAGRAVEFALTRNGEPTADERILNVSDIIGLTRCARVVTQTDLTVRVIDFVAIKKERDALLETFANTLIREAAILLNSVNRDRFIRSQEYAKTIREEVQQHQTQGRQLSREVLRQRTEILSQRIILEEQGEELERFNLERLKIIELLNPAITALFSSDSQSSLQLAVKILDEFHSYKMRIKRKP